MLTVKQNPIQGRMCGFANLSDRRMLYELLNFSDPPLVLELSFPECSDLQYMLP
jgi:hypothetical protein